MFFDDLFDGHSQYAHKEEQRRRQLKQMRMQQQQQQQMRMQQQQAERELMEKQRHEQARKEQQALRENKQRALRRSQQEAEERRAREELANNRRKKQEQSRPAFDSFFGCGFDGFEFFPTTRQGTKAKDAVHKQQDCAAEPKPLPKTAPRPRTTTPPPQPKARSRTVNPQAAMSAKPIPSTSKASVRSKTPRETMRERSSMKKSTSRTTTPQGATPAAPASSTSTTPRAPIPEPTEAAAPEQVPTVSPRNQSQTKIQQIIAAADAVREQWGSQAFTAIACEEERYNIKQARAFLEEGLLQQVLKLDGVEAHGDSEIRKARKQAVVDIEGWVYKLKDFSMEHDFDKIKSDDEMADEQDDDAMSTDSSNDDLFDDASQ